MSINRATISGNLTRDAEIRRTQGGMSILTLGVAVNDRRKNPQTGEWEDYANFIDCTMFGTRAESLSSYLVKGTKVAIEGKLRWSQWEKDGQKRSKVEVIIDEIEFMSRQNGSNGGGYQQQGNIPQQANNAPQAAPQQAQMPTIDASSAVYDDDIPF